MGSGRRRLLILGNSAAAVSAVRAIRSRAGDHRVTVVSREACVAYSPVLTTYYLRGVMPEERLFFCDTGFYRRHGVDCVFGRAAVAVDTVNRTVALDDGGSLPYDALLIATGASPTRLAGLDEQIAAGLCYLRTIDDARRIRKLAQRARRAAILGAGLVSLQTAAAIARPGLEVTCIVGSSQVLSQNLDEQSAAIVGGHVAERGGVELLFGRTVTSISGLDGGLRLDLSTGERLDVDMVVVGKGVTPNLGFVDPGQIRVDRGIVVDDRLQTSAEQVYAAGDVAQGRNRISGESQVVANWIDACEQGRVAGLNMAGADVPYPGSVPENVTTLFGLPTVSVGVVRTNGESTALHAEVVSRPARKYYRKIVYEADVPVGAIIVGDVRDAGIVRAAIARGEQDSPSLEGTLRSVCDPFGRRGGERRR